MACAEDVLDGVWCGAAGPVKQLKIDQRVFLTPTKRKLDVNIVQSNYHIEITPRCVAFCMIHAWTSG